MSINEIIVYLMVVFMALGAVDRILGNRFGWGRNLRRVSWLWAPWPWHDRHHLSGPGAGQPAPAGGGASLPGPGGRSGHVRRYLLANDMGGAPLAQELALTQEAGQFGGLIVGSMLGPTIVFTIRWVWVLSSGGPPLSGHRRAGGCHHHPIGSFAGAWRRGFRWGWYCVT